MARSDEYERVAPDSRDAWRRWLAEHHAESQGVWLTIAKKNSSSSSPSYEEAVEEALSFGWIDSTVRAVDAECFMQLFTPRKPRSVWSRSNKLRVERLLAEGRMHPAGMAAVETAKANGSWESLDEVEDLTVPSDLAQAFASDKEAARAFDELAESKRKMLLYWLASAKRAETRSRRIGAILTALDEGTMPF